MKQELRDLKPGEERCKECHRCLPIARFYSDKRLKRGHGSVCKKCIKAKQRRSSSYLRKKASVEEKSDTFTVYGYMERRTGAFRYIGCTQCPLRRRLDHEDYRKNSGETYSRYPQDQFKYHVFIDGVTKCEGLEEESILIKKWYDILDNKNKTNGYDPSMC